MESAGGGGNGAVRGRMPRKRGMGCRSEDATMVAAHATYKGRRTHADWRSRQQGIELHVSDNRRCAGTAAKR